ncbi:MAG: hypothetical protein ACRDHF_00555 [Tepidiformaceae bacterium]
MSEAWTSASVRRVAVKVIQGHALAAPMVRASGPVPLHTWWYHRESRTVTWDVADDVRMALDTGVWAYCVPVAPPWPGPVDGRVHQRVLRRALMAKGAGFISGRDGACPRS